MYSTNRVKICVGCKGITGQLQRFIAVKHVLLPREHIRILPPQHVHLCMTEQEHS